MISNGSNALRKNEICGNADAPVTLLLSLLLYLLLPGTTIISIINVTKCDDSDLNPCFRFNFVVLPDLFTIHTPHLAQPGTEIEQKYVSYYTIQTNHNAVGLYPVYNRSHYVSLFHGSFAKQKRSVRITQEKVLCFSCLQFPLVTRWLSPYLISFNFFSHHCFHWFHFLNLLM